MRNRLFRRLPLLIFILVLGACLSLAALYLSNRKRTPDLPSPPLYELAKKHGVQLGNFAIYTHLHDKPYANILTSQFNLALIDNTPNWYFLGGGLRPSPTSYNFQQMDKIVSFSKKHHMAIQAHHLVWGEEKWLPDWLKNGHYSPQQLLALIRGHILTVAGRYRGQIQQWTVVNEAFSRQQHIYGLHDWWSDHIGDESYISDAFIWARQADPHATLILNDFNDETKNSISDAIFNYVKSAKAQGVPIDGIGMQMHIDGTNPPSKQAVIDNMRRFAAIGVKAYVTEFDVNMNNVKASNDEKNKEEANIYYQMMRACIESGSCPSFSILGITDSETWYNYLGETGAMPLPFDKNYQPKPAYYSLRLALQQS